MDFNFSSTSGTSQSNSLPQLKGNAIYKVTFKGVEKRDIVGVKDPSQTYKVLDVKFAGVDGYFTHTIFEPRQEDTVRRPGFNESAQPKPSAVEDMMLLFKHLIDATNPELAKEIDAGTKNIGAKGWDNLRDVVIKATEKGIGIETNIKLITNNKGEARFPYFSIVSKDSDKAIIAGNFIGERLYFTAYEQSRIDNATTAKPTNFSGAGSESKSDFEFDMNF